jgi:hypothetical protein
VEATTAQEQVNNKPDLRQFLGRHGIEIPEEKNGLSGIPGKWLLRGTADKTSLFSGRMEPKTGEYGSEGIFLTDKPSEVFTYNQGMIVVMESNVQEGNWIQYPSLKFSELASQEAREHGYDETKVVGGLNAENEVFKKYKIYQPEKGCATFPRAVDMDKASLILVTPNFLNQEDLGRMSPAVRGKIVSFI